MTVTSSGRRHNFLELQNPVGEAIADGDGEYQSDYETFTELFASVDPATAQKLERFASSVPIASATHIVVIPFDPNVSTLTRIRWDDGFSIRKLSVVGYADPSESHIELVLVCQETKK